MKRSNSRQSEPEEEEKNEEDDENSKEININEPNPFEIRNPFAIWNQGNANFDKYIHKIN